jgi:hypothetical protein
VRVPVAAPEELPVGPGLVVNPIELVTAADGLMPEFVGLRVADEAAVILLKVDAVAATLLLPVAAGDSDIPEAVATPEVVGSTDAEGAAVAETAALELPRPEIEPQLPVETGVSVGPTDAVTYAEILKDAAALSLAAPELLITGLSDPTADTVADAIPLAVAASLKLADTDTEPVPVELLVGAELAVCVTVLRAVTDSVELTRDDTELVVEPVPVFETEIEPEAVRQAVTVFETEADLVPLTDTVPVFVPAMLRVELPLTVLLAEAERLTLADPLALLAPDVVTEAEGEIVGSIVCVEEGAAEAELLSEAWAEKDTTEAVGVTVPLRLFVRDTDGVRVWDHVGKSVDVDVAEAGTDPVTELETVLLPTILLLGDTEAVLVFETELLPERVKLVSALRDDRREPDVETDMNGVFDLTADAENVGELELVFERLDERVLVADRLDVLLSPGFIVPLTDIV